MTDYDDLIQRLSVYFANTGLSIGTDAADAIKELVAERDAQFRLRHDLTGMLWEDRCRRERDRAEKAEADLATARECIRWGWKGQHIRPDHKHAPAIAAARAEGGE